MEQAIKTILATLPQEIYRDFDHRFKLSQTEPDDMAFELYIDIFPENKIRVYYYGDNSLATTIHEEYWNGERYEQFADGGFTIDASSINKGKLQSWFYRVFRVDTAAAREVNIEGLDQKLQLIFSILDNKIMNDDGEQHVLTVTACRTIKGFGIDIHYLNVKSKESIWLMDGHIMNLTDVTPDLLKTEYEKEVRGFTPCLPSA